MKYSNTISPKQKQKCARQLKQIADTNHRVYTGWKFHTKTPSVKLTSTLAEMYTLFYKIDSEELLTQPEIDRINHFLSPTFKLLWCLL